jgi:hypothetical protein
VLDFGMVENHPISDEIAAVRRTWKRANSRREM